VLATGPAGAVFREVGGDLARAIHARSPRTALRVLTTAATVENLALLAGARADLGFGAIDAVVSDPRARAGTIGTICRLYDSFLHLVVLDGSPIRSLRDLAGKRVALGAAGSGTEFTATTLLTATGVRPGQQPRLGQDPAMAAVGAGTVDAAFSLTGFPTPAITQLAQRRRIRMVPLGDYFRILDRAIPRVYGPAPIPEGAYPDVPATDTVYVPNVLLGRPGLTDDAVTLVIEAVLSPSSRQFWTHPDSRRFDVRAAIATGPLDLHPAALAWLRAQKP
jgi:TRAP transporter TAXI family solute receptor